MSSSPRRSLARSSTLSLNVFPYPRANFILVIVLAMFVSPFASLLISLTLVYASLFSLSFVSFVSATATLCFLFLLVSFPILCAPLFIFLFFYALCFYSSYAFATLCFLAAMLFVLLLAEPNFILASVNPLRSIISYFNLLSLTYSSYLIFLLESISFSSAATLSYYTFLYAFIPFGLICLLLL